PRLGDRQGGRARALRERREQRRHRGAAPHALARRVSMIAAAGALALFAVVLAWPAPALLARARWPLRAPGTALLAWQSIALAGALAMLGALLVFGLAPYGDDLVSGLAAFVDGLRAGSVPAAATFPHLFSVSAAVLLGGHLLLNLV